MDDYEGTADNLVHINDIGINVDEKTLGMMSAKHLETGIGFLH